MGTLGREQQGDHAVEGPGSPSELVGNATEPVGGPDVRSRSCFSVNGKAGEANISASVAGTWLFTAFHLHPP